MNTKSQLHFFLGFAWIITVLCGCTNSSTVQIVIFRPSENVQILNSHLMLETFLVNNGFRMVNPMKDGKPNADSLRVDDSRGVASFFEDPLSPKDASERWGLMLRSDRQRGDLRLSLDQTTVKRTDAMNERSKAILDLLRQVAPGAHIEKQE
jgi:hypothetical protein